MITALPASTTFTPKQALISAMEFADNDDLKDVLVVGYDGDGDLVIRSSRMDRKDALWLCEMLRNWALSNEN